MYAYKEVIILDDLQRITLKRPLAMKKGQKVEVLILAESENDELETIRDHIEAQNINEADISDAINWARNA
jgi:hypothetical protein